VIRSLSTLILTLCMFVHSAMAMDFQNVMSGPGLDARLVIQSFERTCGDINKPFAELTDENLTNMCNIVLETKACKSVKEEDLRSCDFNEPEEAGSALDLLTGCAQGLFESVKELLTFIWDVMKFAWKSATDSEYRGKKLAQAGSYMESAKLYLDTEYQKAYDETSFPFRKIKAMKKMGGAIAQMIMSLIQKTISSEMTEFSCLNSQAKSKYTCKLIGDIFLPPAVALALIKKGPAALKSVGALSTAFDKMKKNIKKDKRNDFPDNMDAIDAKDFDDELASLEKMLKNQGFAEDLHKGRVEMYKLLNRKPPEKPATPEEIALVNNTYMAKIAKYFNEEGIPYKVADYNKKNKTDIAEIEIDFSYPSNNPVFLKLKKYNDKLGKRKLKFALHYLDSNGAAGVYRGGHKEVKINLDNLGKIIKGENATTLTHEYRHSMFHKNRDQGKDSIFYGKLHSDKDGVKVSEIKAYEKYISMEELYNHSSDTFDMLKRKKKMSSEDFDFVKRKSENVKHISDAVYANSKEIFEVGKSFKAGTSISQQKPYTLTTKEGHEIRITSDPASDRGQIEISYNGKKYVEPVVTAQQQAAFNKVREGFQDFHSTGSLENFNGLSMPRLTRLVEDIQEKSVKRARIARYQSDWSGRLSEYMDRNTIDTVNIDTMKAATGLLKQGVRENKKGIYDGKLLPGEN